MAYPGEFSEWISRFIASDFRALFNADRLQTVAIAAAKPTSGQALFYNATTDRYEPSAISFPAGTTAAPSLNIPVGVAPSSPVDGDVWRTTLGLYYRQGSVTVGPLGYWS